MYVLETDDELRSLSIDEVVDRIIYVNSHLADFWSHAHGWAPPGAAELLAKSRLDWQVSLSKCLRFAIRQLAQTPEEDGALILAWVNLGCLVEGTMKLFLAVYYDDYQKDSDAFKKRDASLIDPDVIEFERLRQFFERKTLFDSRFSPFVQHVQQRRNGIHAFKNRDIGTPAEFFEDVRNYLELLNEVTSGFPYPDEPRYRE